jgi:hypothetical protein
VMKRYKKENAYLVPIDKKALSMAHYESIGGNFLGKMVRRNKSDPLVNRSLIRHDADTLCSVLMEIYEKHRSQLLR